MFNRITTQYDSAARVLSLKLNPAAAAEAIVAKADAVAEAADIAATVLARRDETPLYRRGEVTEEAQEAVQDVLDGLEVELSDRDGLKLVAHILRQYDERLVTPEQRSKIQKAQVLALSVMAELHAPAGKVGA